MSDSTHGWKDALAPTPECIDIARLGEPLEPAAQAHLDTCPRCQAELALFREFQSDAATTEEAEAGAWIAGELQRRLAEPAKVVPFRSKWQPVFYAVAAMLLLIIGAGTWLQLREPSVDEPLDPAQLYRGERLDIVAPAGDLAAPPNELRWTAVPNASRYHVRILEVDATLLWSGETAATQLTLPDDVRARFAPGKSLRWDVKAFRGNEVIASSETETVRVKTP